MTSLLFRLDAEWLRNTCNHYRTDNQKRLRVVMVVASLVFALWYYVFRHVIAKKTGMIEHWEAVRLLFPMLLTFGAASIGGYKRQSRWLGRWSGGSWSVLPIETRSIAVWVLGTNLAVDLLWLVLGLVISVGVSYILNLTWWREFPFMLLGALMLISLASVVKVLATSLLRLGSDRMLNWPNWVMRLLSGILAMVFMSPLVGFWGLAVIGQERGSAFVTIAALFILVAGTAGLALAARALMISHWSLLAYSFEVQETHRRSTEKLRVVSLIARAMRSPVTKLFTLYNLREGMQLNNWNWGQKVTIGRRFHYFALMVTLVSVMLGGFCIISIHEMNPEFVAIGGGGWTAMLMVGLMPPVLPAYRLLRMFPVSFGEWLRALVALPLAIAIPWLLICCVVVVLADPTTAFRSFGIILGLFFGAVPLRVAMVSAYPDKQQTVEFAFMAVIALCAAVYYYVSWMAVVPLVLAANIYLFRKAAREWRWREEGLSV